MVKYMVHGTLRIHSVAIEINILIMYDQYLLQL